MDYDTLRPFFIWPHGLFGGAVLLSGAVAIATKKGSPTHIKAGAVFYWSMLAALVAALPLMILTKNHFLLGLTPLTAYLVIAGRRTVWRRKNGHKVLTPFDRWLALGTATISGALAAYGGYAMTKGSSFGIVAVVLGGIGLLQAGSDWKNRDRKPERATQYVEQHLGYMMAAFIAATTAFSAVNLGRVEAIPTWLTWLWPTVLGTAAITVFTRRLKNRTRRR